MFNITAMLLQRYQCILAGFSQVKLGIEVHKSLCHSTCQSLLIILDDTYIHTHNVQLHILIKHFHSSYHVIKMT